MSMKLRPGGWGEAVSDGTHLEVNAEEAAVNHTRFEVGGTGPTSKRPTEFSGCTYDGSRRLSSSASFVTALCDARWVANTCRNRTPSPFSAPASPVGANQRGLVVGVGAGSRLLSSYRTNGETFVQINANQKHNPMNHPSTRLQTSKCKHATREKSNFHPRTIAKI